MRTLMVTVPGLFSSSKNWAPLCERLSREPALGETEWFPWEHRVGLLTRGRLDSFGLALDAAISERCGDDFDQVLLMGHSIGALIVRCAFIMASVGGHSWARRVRAIILFAGLNRGAAVRSDKNRDVKPKLYMRLLAWLRRLVPVSHLVVDDAISGSDFITNLRLAWINYFASVSGTERPVPAVIQFLGARDGLVGDDDSADLLAFRNATAVPVDTAKHGNLVRLDKTPDPEGRYRYLRDRILACLRDSYGPLPPVVSGGQVVFILHGIRALNAAGWVRQVAQQVKAAGAIAVNPEYGFFSAIRFALPRVRRRNIRKFQDAYSEQLAKTPGAEFNFIGHSNGTYMMGESLRRIAAMRFERVVLAGSVLPEEFPWHRMNVGRVINACADRDAPVALLSYGLRGLGMKDVGRGGFLGFQGGSLTNESFFTGGHGAALTPTNIPRLVQYALQDQQPAPAALVGSCGWFVQLSNLAVYAVPALVLGILVLAGWWVFAGFLFHPGRAVWSIVALALLYAFGDSF